MTHLTETDMREFEGALNEDWCHTAVEGDDACDCGAPVSDEPFHSGRYVAGRCTGCGRRACPECARLDEDDL